MGVKEMQAQAVKRVISFAELSTHCTDGDAWIAISDKVYDVSHWLTRHPGGHLPLLDVAGGDATDVFRAMHSPQVWARLSEFYIGSLEPGPNPRLSEEEKQIVEDYKALARRIQGDGLLQPRPWAYAQQALVLALVFALILAGILLTQSVVVHLLCALLLGFWWNQISFIGHDAGHNAITGSNSIDGGIGFVVGNLLTGISIGWWKRTHNVHHVVCNSVEYDPDLQHIPVFAVSRSFFESRFSAYHSRHMTFDTLARLLVSHQHLTFYPIMAIARVNLYIQSLLLLFSTHRLDHRTLEAASMAAFWVWYSALLLCLPSAWERAAFVVLSHAVTGILHVQICLSHFASPTYEGRRDAAVWAKTQLLGSVDISCSPQLDWFHGGLQFQVEHHLFPRVPRRNLRAISPAVRAFCRKHGLPYSSLSFWDANIMTLSVLREAALEARKEGWGHQSSFFQSLLWDALNAKG